MSHVLPDIPTPPHNGHFSLPLQRGLSGKTDHTPHSNHIITGYHFPLHVNYTALATSSFNSKTQYSVVRYTCI